MQGAQVQSAKAFTRSDPMDVVDDFDEDLIVTQGAADSEVIILFLCKHE